MDAWNPATTSQYTEGLNQLIDRDINNQVAPETVDPLSAIGQLEDPPELSLGEELISGQYSPFSGQQGGMVRNDMALLDMIYRR